MSAPRLKAAFVRVPYDVAKVPIASYHQARASMQGKPKQVLTYETTPEPSTRGVVDIT